MEAKSPLNRRRWMQACAAPWLAPATTRAQAAPLRIAAPDFPGYMSALHPGRGLSVDIIRESLALSGIGVHFDLMPIRRASQAIASGTHLAQAGSVEFLPAAMQARLRQTRLMRVPAALVFRRDAPQAARLAAVDSLHALSEWTVVMPFAPLPLELAAQSQSEVPGPQDVFAMINHHRVHFGVLPMATLRALVDADPATRITDYQLIGRPLGVDRSGVVFDTLHPATDLYSRALEEGYRALLASGRVEALRHQYLDPLPWQALLATPPFSEPALSIKPEDS